MSVSIATIRQAQNDYLDAQALIHGENTTLTPAVNTEITDGAAGVLATVNPNNDYPPKPKP